MFSPRLGTTHARLVEIIARDDIFNHHVSRQSEPAHRLVRAIRVRRQQAHHVHAQHRPFGDGRRGARQIFARLFDFTKHRIVWRLYHIRKLQPRLRGLEFSKRIAKRHSHHCLLHRRRVDMQRKVLVRHRFEQYVHVTARQQQRLTRQFWYAYEIARIRRAAYFIHQRFYLIILFKHNKNYLTSITKKSKLITITNHLSRNIATFGHIFVRGDREMLENVHVRLLPVNFTHYFFFFLLLTFCVFNKLFFSS